MPKRKTSPNNTSRWKRLDDLLGRVQDEGLDGLKRAWQQFQESATSKHEWDCICCGDPRTTPHETKTTEQNVDDLLRAVAEGVRKRWVKPNLRTARAKKKPAKRGRVAR
jgi:hypothetical protein